MASFHQPVLVDEVVSWLLPVEQPGVIIVDATAGGGGHAAALARKIGRDGRVIGLERDPAMLELAREATRGMPVTIVHAAYKDTRRVLKELEIEQVSGLLLDLGVSSDQLAWTERGFSFSHDGPLDMRFDPGEPVPSAADLVNRLPEDQLARLFFEFGEERFSRRISRRIVEARRKSPIRTTVELAELVRRAVPPTARRGPIHPATRVFQAIRIAVNDELGQLDAMLSMIPELLLPGGRAAVISFHSLEDRRVKWAFKSCPKLKVLTRKPITPTDQERAVNPRARSAKMRVVERCRNLSSS
jgi:16S rRNA (cytosine1402-N4)-methyltransferase